jgi:Rod binding domain-containing protein
MDISTLLTAQGAGAGRTSSVVDKAQLEAEAQRTGEKFEAMFLAQMMAPMFDGVGEGGLFGGQSAKAYKSVLMEEYGKAMAANGGVGIADQVKAEILKMQEATR